MFRQVILVLVDVKLGSSMDNTSDLEMNLLGYLPEKVLNGEVA